MATALLGSPASTGLGAEPNNSSSEMTPALERRVSLTGEPRSRRKALEDICRQAGIVLKLDTEALAEDGLKLDESVSVIITNEPLQYALGRLIDWHQGGFYPEVRNGQLLVTTMGANQKRITQSVPDWLKPLVNKGLLVTVDDSGNVTSLNAGEVMTDELLAKLTTLPKLRELHIEVTRTVSPVGLAHLASLTALEKLTLFNVNREGAGLGDDALRCISGLKSLLELYMSECGTTDAGARLLESMPQLTHLKLYQEGRLTDAALASIAKIKGLKHLDLSCYVPTEAYGRMIFTPEGLRQLTVLQELEELQLVGQAPAADFFAFPKLTALSVGKVNDTAAARIAQCRRLKYLGLMYSDITDDGLKLIATLPEVRSLDLRSLVISDAGMSHLRALSHLEHLTLRASKVSDKALKHLSEMKALTRLDLYGSGESGVHLGTCFTPEGLQQLKNLPNLRILWLINLRLNGGFSVLKQLTQLRQLTLMMTDIREDEVVALENALPDTSVSDGRRVPSARRKPAASK